MNRLCNIIEPFPALFLQKVTKPAGLASLNPGTGTVRQGSVRFNLTEEVSPPTHFLSSCTYSMVLSLDHYTNEILVPFPLSLQSRTPKISSFVYKKRSDYIITWPVSCVQCTVYLLCTVYRGQQEPDLAGYAARGGGHIQPSAPPE